MSHAPDLSPASRRRARRVRRHIRRWSVGLAVYATSAFAAGGAAATAFSPPDAAEGAWGAAVDRLDSARARSAEVNARIGVLETALRAERAASGRPDWSLLLRFIADRAAGVAVLDELTIGPHPEAQGNEAFVVLIRGRSSGAAAAASLTLALESSGVFSEVGQSSAGRARGRGGASGAAFEIRAVLGEPAPPPSDDEDEEGDG
jgi:hypothetical protein